MNAMSQRDRRARTFVCRDDLYDAFEARARELQCSVDWLIAEAMKRLLANPALAPQAPQPSSRSVRPPAPPSLHGGPLVPPPPPPRRRTTGSFVGPRENAETRIALRVRDEASRAVVDRDRFVLGRSSKDAHLTLRDGGVSRQHAIIERTGPSAWVVVDMASTNGVHVNGVRVTRAPIAPGDVLEIGPFTIAVEPA